MSILKSGKVPTCFNVTLTNADTQYSLADNSESGGATALPPATKQITFQCRTHADIRWSWVTGKVAGPTSAYMTLKAGMSMTLDSVDLTNYPNANSVSDIYFASGTAGVVVEVEAWQ